MSANNLLVNTIMERAEPTVKGPACYASHLTPLHLMDVHSPPIVPNLLCSQSAKNARRRQAGRSERATAAQSPFNAEKAPARSSGLIVLTLPPHPEQPTGSCAGTHGPFPGCRFIQWDQIRTADTAFPETNRIGLAVEPLACPPDAFDSGTDLIALGAGKRHEASWVIAAL